MCTLALFRSSSMKQQLIAEGGPIVEERATRNNPTKHYLFLRCSSTNPVSKKKDLKEAMVEILEHPEKATEHRPGVYSVMVEIVDAHYWRNDLKNDMKTEGEFEFDVKFITSDIKEKANKKAKKDEDGKEMEDENIVENNIYSYWVYKVGECHKITEEIPFTGTNPRGICNLNMPDANLLAQYCIKTFGMEWLDNAKCISTACVDRYILQMYIENKRLFEIRSKHYPALDPKVEVKFILINSRKFLLKFSYVNIYLYIGFE